MIVGVTFTLILGVGLMSLIFFSSRNGFDEPPDVQLDGTREGGGDASRGERR